MNQQPHQIACGAVLFDLDGVLIDSTSCIVRHWKDWADQHGLDVNTIMHVAHGIQTVETIRQVAPHVDAEQEAAQFTAHEVADTCGVVAIEGAYRMLTALPEDAPAGIEAGQKAGMRVIGVQTTHTRKELLEKGADIVIDRLTHLTILKTAYENRLVIQIG